MRVGAKCRGTRVGEPPRNALWRFAADDAFATAATRALAFCRGPCFGFQTPTVQRSTEPLLRGKAPASPITTAPAEMRQEVDLASHFWRCLSPVATAAFQRWAFTIAARSAAPKAQHAAVRNRRVSTRRSAAPTVPDAPSRRGVAALRRAARSGRAGSMPPPRPE